MDNSRNDNLIQPFTKLLWHVHICNLATQYSTKIACSIDFACYCYRLSFFLKGIALCVLFFNGVWHHLVGLSKERPILDHHAKVHILDFMKSGGFRTDFR